MSNPVKRIEKVVGRVLNKGQEAGKNAHELFRRLFKKGR